jgi:hypothetical protein
MGDTSVEAPQPTAEEKALQTEQLSLLREQRAETEAFKPFLMQSMGFREGEGGALEQIPWEERLAAMDPQERAGHELASSYLERQQQALAGELPVSPAMEAELAKQKEELVAGLSGRLGPDWQASTPGIQAMSEFEKRAELLREEARRGQLSTGEGLLQARQGQLQGAQAQQYGQQSSFGLPQFGALTQGYTQAFQPFQFNRQQEFGARQQTAANRAGVISGITGAVGTGIGLYAGLA